MPTCPSCQSNNVKLNGHIHNGKQNHLCKIVAANL
jgi:transposase-like protein